MNPPEMDHPLPLGYRRMPVKTAYLEIISKPKREPAEIPEGGEVKRWERPDSDEYRALFKAVGGEWGWSGRLILQEEELKAIIHAETTDIYVLKCSGDTAGFAELDRSVPGQAEIAYFGLLPGFIGRGLGRFFLDWTIHRAWQGKTERVWLHTCEFDHPKALETYLKAGFRVYAEKVEMQPYPEQFLQQPSTAGH